MLRGLSSPHSLFSFHNALRPRGKFMHIPKVCRIDPCPFVIVLGAGKATKSGKEKTDAVCSDDLPHTRRV